MSNKGFIFKNELQTKVNEVISARLLRFIRLLDPLKQQNR